MSRTARPNGTFKLQLFVSEARPFPSYGPKHVIKAEVRFDDSLSNGQNSFSITAIIYRLGARDIDGGGCCHAEIAAAFPELAHLIPWHMTDTRAPWCYNANVTYFAGNRDHNGLLKGERRPIMAADGISHWDLEAIDGTPARSLTQHFKGDEPPPVPSLQWVQSCRIGEGKERQLDLARNAAVWPEATDAELSRPTAELNALLQARLPALMVRFRSDMEAAGFQWEAITI